MLWGFKVVRHHGGHSEHVESSKPMHSQVQLKEMPDGFSMPFTGLLTARTDCLPTSRLCTMLVLVLVCPSCSCWSARGRALVLMFVLDCTSPSCLSDVELQLVFECSLFGVHESHLTQAHVMSRIYNIVNVFRHLLGDLKVLPRHYLRDMRPL